MRSEDSKHNQNKVIHSFIYLFFIERGNNFRRIQKCTTAKSYTFTSKKQGKQTMKKILLALLALTALSFAGDFEDGLKAANAKDYKTAVTLWQKAADQGDAGAQYNLGNSYYNGRGVKQSYKKAAALFQKAADQGYAGAQSNLGILYYKGQGVKQSNKKAKELFGKACDGGFQSGCNNYAILNKR